MEAMGLIAVLGAARSEWKEKFDCTIENRDGLVGPRHATTLPIIWNGLAQRIWSLSVGRWSLIPGVELKYHSFSKSMNDSKSAQCDALMN